VVQTHSTWKRYLGEIKPAFVSADNGFIRRYYREWHADILPILKHYPRAAFIVLEGADHSLQIEQEDEFNYIFRRFLFKE